MGGRIVFITGGSRSGKTRFALSLGMQAPAPRLYIATAEARDDEMRERITNHKKERHGAWETIEETKDLATSVRGAEKYGVLIIDCITLWMSNLIEAGLTDEAIVAEAGRLAGACRAGRATAILISNEVGMGIVPENPLARRFRDLSGIVNQSLAASADEVYLIVSGIPLRVK